MCACLELRARRFHSGAEREQVVRALRVVVAPVPWSYCVQTKAPDAAATMLRIQRSLIELVESAHARAPLSNEHRLQASACRVLLGCVRGMCWLANDPVEGLPRARALLARLEVRGRRWGEVSDPLSNGARHAMQLYLAAVNASAALVLAVEDGDDECVEQLRSDVNTATSRLAAEDVELVVVRWVREGLAPFLPLRRGQIRAVRPSIAPEREDDPCDDEDIIAQLAAEESTAGDAPLSWGSAPNGR